MLKTRQRTHAQKGVPWISDGKRAYPKAIGRIYRDPHRRGTRGRPPLVPTPGVGLTQAVKRRRRGRIVGVEVRRVFGEPVDCPYPVHQERLNGVLRDRLNALTRKTHGFAKRVSTWDALVVVCLFEHNWIRPHAALRERVEGRYRQRTPAVAVGLTNHVWSWEEFLTFRHYHYQRG